MSDAASNGALPASDGLPGSSGTGAFAAGRGVHMIFSCLFVRNVGRAVGSIPSSPFATGANRPIVFLVGEPGSDNLVQKFGAP